MSESCERVATVSCACVHLSDCFPVEGHKFEWSSNIVCFLECVYCTSNNGVIKLNVLAILLLINFLLCICQVRGFT